MTTRPKLNIPLNNMIIIELLFDEPVTGKNQYGNYYLYAVKKNDQEYSYFATADVHESLKNCKKGDRVGITKLASRRGGKFHLQYMVNLYPDDETANVADVVKKVADSMDMDKALHKKSDKQEISVDENAAIPNLTDFFYDVLLKSYQDALKMQKELNQNIDPEKAAVTLFIARSKIPVK